MSKVKPVVREVRESVLTGMAHSKDKLHQLADNLDDHFDTIVKRVKDKDNFDGKPDTPNRPNTPHTTPGNGDGPDVTQDANGQWRDRDGRFASDPNRNGNPRDPNDNRPYLDPGSRPSLRDSTVRDTWENAKGPDGKVYDPNPPYEEIVWDPDSGVGRNGIWDMGHVPDEKYHDMWQRYVDGEMTPAEFRDWYNDPSNYRPEIPGKNRGHRFE